MTATIILAAIVVLIVALSGLALNIRFLYHSEQEHKVLAGLLDRTLSELAEAVRGQDAQARAFTAILERFTEKILAEPAIARQHSVERAVAGEAAAARAAVAAARSAGESPGMMAAPVPGLDEALDPAEINNYST